MRGLARRLAERQHHGADIGRLVIAHEFEVEIFLHQLFIAPAWGVSKYKQIATLASGIADFGKSASAIYQ